MSQSDKEIQSQLHNYLTIACNYRFDVLVTLISGEKFKGQAFATGTNEQNKTALLYNRRKASSLSLPTELAH